MQFSKDSSVPFWRSNVDVESLYTAHAHCPNIAQSLLRYLEIPETAAVFDQAVTMRGMFTLGYLGNHTYTWTFTPGAGARAVVFPVYSDFQLVDLLAVSRINPNHIWGCVTGAGQHVGKAFSKPEPPAPPLKLHSSPINWLASGCEGILPLAKTFFPQLQAVESIIAEDYEHAWLIAQCAFIQPAAAFGQNESEAEQKAFDHISVVVEE